MAETVSITIRKLIFAVPSAALICLALSGCAKKPPVPVRPAPTGAQSIEDAHATVIRAITTNPAAPFRKVDALKVHHGSIEVTFPDIRIWIPLHQPITEIPSPIRNFNPVNPAPLLRTDLHLTAIWRKGGKPATSKNYFITFLRQDDALPFVLAFNELVARYQDVVLWWGEFETKAAAWRASNPKPLLSEAATKHRILAEDAVRKNDPLTALAHFAAALGTDPTWPAGNLNVALLLANHGDYGSAVQYLKHFLLLEPDGHDSELARRNIVLWENEAMPEIPR